MAARTAKRLESVQLFSSDRVCLESIQPLCWIESAKKALSCFVSFEYASDIYGYFHQLYMPRSIQSLVLQTHNITNILFNFSQVLRAQFTSKASEEQEVECDEPLK